MLTASGDTLSVDGIFVGEIGFALNLINHPVVVANMGNTHGVLSMDLIQRYVGPIELSNGMIKVGESTLYLHREATAYGYPILASCFTSVEPGSSIRLPGQLDDDPLERNNHQVFLAYTTMKQKRLGISLLAQEPDSTFSLQEVKIHAVRGR